MAVWQSLDLAELAREELGQFRYIELDISCRASTTIALPDFAGSSLRGALGHALRTISCRSQASERCGGCLVSPMCPYHLVFEAGEGEVHGKIQPKDIPRGYVLRVPFDHPRILSPGDVLRFSIVLVGRIASLVPYLVMALQQLGTDGIGKGRGKFQLDRVVQVSHYSAEENRVLYDQKQGTTSSWPGQPQAMDLAISPPYTKAMRLEFITPTRVKSQGQLASTLPFGVVARTVVRRMSLLNEIYNRVPTRMDLKRLIELADTVETINSDLRWLDWERYSNRQSARMKFGGVIGAVTYRGEALRVFQPWLRLSEVVHVGKNTTFGMGFIHTYWG